MPNTMEAHKEAPLGLSALHAVPCAVHAMHPASHMQILLFPATSGDRSDDWRCSDKPTCGM
jgi:hypothetical protein